MPTPPTFEAQFAASVDRIFPHVSKALAPAFSLVEPNPKGMDAVVLSALLRAYADAVELGFEEGDNMGPLKTAVDNIRERFFKTFQDLG